MKKYTIVVLFLIVGLLFGGVFYQNNKVDKEKSIVEGNVELSDSPLGMYDFYFDIENINEKGEAIRNVEYVASTFNNTFTYPFETHETHGYMNEHESEQEYYQRIYDTMSAEQKELIDSIKTTEDFSTLEERGVRFECSNNPYILPSQSVSPNGTGTSELNNEGTERPRYCYIDLPTYITLEETKVPTGYVKDKYFVPGLITVGYENFEKANSENLDYDTKLLGIVIMNGNTKYAIRYGNVNRNLLTGINIENAAQVWNRYKTEDVDYIDDQSVANNSVAIPRLGFTDLSDDVFLEVHNTNMTIYGGTVSLEATTSVNSVNSYTTNINQTLEYKVNIKNAGSADSVDNTVTVTLPEGFIYVDNSASNGGVYENGTISWNIERIAPGVELEYTFKAFASRSVTAGQDYSLSANIDSFSLDKPVDSNKTKVRLALQNPSTYAPRATILIVLLLAAWTVYLAAVGYKKQTQE